MTNNLYRFKLYCGRMGVVESIFAATEEEISKVFGKEVYFGEILGKHSDIFCTVEEEMITLLTDDSRFVKKLIDIMGDKTISGYNPLERIDWDEEEEEYGIEWA